MPFYRVEFDGYVEGEFDDEEAARLAFLDSVLQIDQDSGHIHVEVFDEEEQVWK